MMATDELIIYLIIYDFLPQSSSALHVHIFLSLNYANVQKEVFCSDCQLSTIHVYDRRFTTLVAHDTRHNY